MGTNRTKQLMATAAGLAALSLALVACGDGDDPVDLDASPVSTTPSTGATSTTELDVPEPDAPTAPTGAVPAHPVLVSHSDASGASLSIVDGDTGRVLATPVTGQQFGINESTITADGTIWFEQESGDTSAVRRIAWGSTKSDAPFGSETASPAISSDGSTLAYVRSGVATPVTALVLVDLATGDTIRELAWAEGDRHVSDPDVLPGIIRGLDWSPDGGQLLFLAWAGDVSEARIVDRDAASLSESTKAFDGDVWFAHWVDGTHVIATVHEPRNADAAGSTTTVPQDDTVVRLHDLVARTSTELALDGMATSVDVDADGRQLVLYKSGRLEIRDGDEVRGLDLDGDVTAAWF